MCTRTGRHLSSTEQQMATDEQGRPCIPYHPASAPGPERTLPWGRSSET